MPWSLDIHILDVGVGEATLIIAQNPEVNAFKSILIDGGLSAMAPVVHRAVAVRLPDGRGPDIVLVTHFDIDHYDGITDLLYADNLTAVIDEVVRVTSVCLDAAKEADEDDDPQTVDTRDPMIIARRVTCAAFGAMAGAWGSDESEIEDAVVALGRGAAQKTYEAAASAGLQAAFKAAGPTHTFGTKSLVIESRAKRAAKAAGVAAANARIKKVPLLPRIRDSLFASLGTLVPELGRFPTDGLYKTTDVIDIGKWGVPKAGYPQAVRGSLESGSPLAAMPGVDRRRSGPPLIGTELFWNGAPPADDAPYAVVVSGPYDATWGWVWTGPDSQAQVVTNGDPSNSKSIGLVIRFNDFTYFTAGDLPSPQEDTFAMALQDTELPDGAGGRLPLPDESAPLVAFKCGHHGADSSTSDEMLAALKPVGAHISCGYHHEHPAETTLDRLEDATDLRHVILTNCRYSRLNVPASPDEDGGPPQDAGTSQWTAGNRAFVSGDNAQDNSAPNRKRGDIWLEVKQGESTGAEGERSYLTVFTDMYPEDGQDGGGARVVKLSW